MQEEDGQDHKITYNEDNNIDEGSMQQQNPFVPFNLVYAMQSLKVEIKNEIFCVLAELRSKGSVTYAICIHFLPNKFYVVLN